MSRWKRVRVEEVGNVDCRACEMVEDVCALDRLEGGAEDIVDTYQTVCSR